MMSINLNSQLYISSGNNRAVYYHPHAENKCIKVNLNPKKDCNKMEVVFYKHYQRTPFDFIARYYGSVKTNLGQGIVIELIRDANGCISRSLEDYLQDGSLTLKEALNYLSRLQAQITRHGILINDDGIQNILMRKDAQGHLTPIMIDGFGPRNIRLKSRIRMGLRPLAKHKSSQVFERMLQRTIA